MNADSSANARSFASRAFQLLIGSVAAQLIPLVCLPVLTRLYLPPAFAGFMIVYGTAVTLYIVLTMRLDSAFLIENDNDSASDLFRLLTRSSVVLAVPAAVALAAFEFGGLANPALWWAALCGFAMFQLSIVWLLRQGLYWKMSGLRICNAIMFVLGSILFGYLGIDKGLIGGLITANIVTALIAFGATGAGKEARQALSSGRVKELCVRHRAFPTKDAPAGLISALSVYLPNFALASWLGQSASGYYALNQRLVQAPSTTVSRAFGEVFKRESSKVYNETGSFHSVIKSFAAIMIPMALGLLIAVQFLDSSSMGRIFGAEWSGAAPVVKILAIRHAIGFVAAPLGFALILVGMQGTILAWQITNLLATVFSLAVGIQLGSVEAFAWSYALSGVALYAAYFGLSYTVSVRGRLSTIGKRGV